MSNNRLKKGGQCKLTPMDLTHTDLIIEWRNDPRITPWFHEKRTFTKAGHEAWLSSQFESELSKNWIILDPVGSPVGAVSLYNINEPDRKAEFGRLVVGPQHQGAGYGAAALELVMDKAAAMGLRSIYLTVKSSNHRAISIYSNFNFQEISNSDGVVTMERSII